MAIAFKIVWFRSILMVRGGAGVLFYYLFGDLVFAVLGGRDTHIEVEIHCRPSCYHYFASHFKITQGWEGS